MERYNITRHLRILCTKDDITDEALTIFTDLNLKSFLKLAFGLVNLNQFLRILQFFYTNIWYSNITGFMASLRIQPKTLHRKI